MARGFHDQAINPLSPPAAPVQGRLQGPPAKSKFLAAISNFLLIPFSFAEARISERGDAHKIWTVEEAGNLVKFQTDTDSEPVTIELPRNVFDSKFSIEDVFLTNENELCLLITDTRLTSFYLFKKSGSTWILDKSALLFSENNLRGLRTVFVRLVGSGKAEFWVRKQDRPKPPFPGKIAIGDTVETYELTETGVQKNGVPLKLATRNDIEGNEVTEIPEELQERAAAD